MYFPPPPVAEIARDWATSTDKEAEIGRRSQPAARMAAGARDRPFLLWKASEGRQAARESRYVL
jgi:hypothetical protein